MWHRGFTDLHGTVVITKTTENNIIRVFEKYRPVYCVVDLGVYCGRSHRICFDDGKTKRILQLVAIVSEFLYAND